LRKRFSSITYFSLAGQEDENVAGADYGQLVDGINDRIH
jgi:hypothetical protein